MLYRLPQEVRHLVHARNQLRTRYAGRGLQFTLDGNLVGDLGEAVVCDLFDLNLVPKRGQAGIDAMAADGRTVQIKATGRGRSFVFTHCEVPASILIAVILRYETEELEVVYNGPYNFAIARLKSPWVGQKHIQVSSLKLLDKDVRPDQRLTPGTLPKT